MSDIKRMFLRLISIEEDKANFNIADPDGGARILTLTPGDGLEVVSIARAPSMGVREKRG